MGTMTSGSMAIAAGLVMLCMVGGAAAQSFTISKPGRLPARLRVTPTGTSISRPGELPIHVRSTSGGGATITRPGRPPLHMRSSSGGGSAVSEAGRLPTQVRPASGGGATIQRPGELPIRVRPVPGGFVMQQSGKPSIHIRRDGDVRSGASALDLAAWLSVIADDDRTASGRR